MSKNESEYVYNLVCVETLEKFAAWVFKLDGKYYEVLGTCDDLTINWLRNRDLFKVAKVKFFSQEIDSRYKYEFLKWIL